MQNSIWKKSGLSAMAVAAVLAFWPAASQAQDAGQPPGQQRPGGQPQQQRGPAPQMRQQAAPQMRQGMPPNMGQRQQRMGAPQGGMAPMQRQGMQRQQMQMQRPQMQMQRQQSQMQRMQRPGMQRQPMQMQRQQMQSGRMMMRRGGVAQRPNVYQNRRAYRGTNRNVTGFAYLGGPRIVVRGYGPGWCRGLHRGRHWAPRIGWHARTHRGLYRCYR